jgi:hypothetical protein
MVIPTGINVLHKERIPVPPPASSLTRRAGWAQPIRNENLIRARSAPTR